MTRRCSVCSVPGLFRILACLGAGLPALAGCGADGGDDPGLIDAGPDAAPAPGPVIADACNPLGFEVCLMPWPSAAYLREADTATGVQVELPIAAMPVNSMGVPVDPTALERFDGFAPSGPMVVAFPGGVSAEGLPAAADPAASLLPDSPVVVVNMDTGERVSVFAEIDANALFPEDAALIIRPVTRLAAGARHAVAIRKSVRALDGGALPVPPGFRALLEGSAPDAPGILDHPRMARLASRAEAVLAALEAEGVARDDLVLAWDFVTASDAFLTSDLLAMRAQALEDMGADGANLSVSLTEVPSDSPLVHRMLSGTYEAPNFLTNGENDDSVLRRDAAGLPVLDGRYQANLTVIVPACVTQATLPRPAIVFGHGLFGSGAGYLDDERLQRAAEEACVVFLAGDFIGLTNRQLRAAAEVATDGGLIVRLTEKLAQAIINFIALEQLARGPLVADPLLQVDGTPMPVPVIDPAQVHYFGASLGGIMGNVVMAYDQGFERGVLGVPGGAWSLLLERSQAWGPLQGILQIAYEEPGVYPIMPALVGMHFEPYDAITTAARVVRDPLPDTPVKQVLLYETTGDSLVSNLSTEMVARTMGLSVLAPSVRMPYGLEASAAPLASGLVIYDEHPSPLPPEGNQPPSEDNGTHGGIHAQGAVLRQAMGFLLEGAIVNECLLDGQPAPCDCATGACE